MLNTIVSPYDWRLISKRPGKEIWARIEGDDIVFREDFIEDMVLEQARQERDAPTFVSPDMKPLGVIPPSVMNRAINEGWANDPKAMRRFIMDIDNRDLRTS